MDPWANESHRKSVYAEKYGEEVEEEWFDMETYVNELLQISFKGTIQQAIAVFAAENCCPQPYPEKHKSKENNYLPLPTRGEIATRWQDPLLKTQDGEESEVSRNMTGLLAAIMTDRWPQIYDANATPEQIKDALSEQNIAQRGLDLSQAGPFTRHL